MVIKKKYYLALVNLILIVPFALFVFSQYSNVDQFLNAYSLKYSVKYDIFDLIKAIKHEVFVFLLSLLSLTGILFWSHTKKFFFISIFYAATQVVLLCTTFSLNFANLFSAFALIVFLWYLIWSNVFSEFENKRGLKLIFLLAGIAIYLLIFLLW